MDKELLQKVYTLKKVQPDESFKESAKPQRKAQNCFKSTLTPGVHKEIKLQILISKY